MYALCVSVYFWISHTLYTHTFMIQRCRQTIWFIMALRMRVVIVMVIVSGRVCVICARAVACVVYGRDESDSEWYAQCSEVCVCVYVWSFVLCSAVWCV